MNRETGPRELASQLRGLILVRLLVMTVLGLLLGWADRTGSLGVSLGVPLVVLAGAWGLTLLYWMGVRVAGLRVLLAAQIALDLIIETVLVAGTGGTSSPLVMLYFLTIFTAGAFLTRRWAVLSAGGATLAFSGVVWIVGDGSGTLTSARGWYETGVHGGALLLLALLSAVLAERSRKSRERMRTAEEELQRATDHTERVLENMPIGVLLAQASGCVTRVNRAAREMVGGGGSPEGGHLADFLGRLSPTLADAAADILLTRRWAAREEVVLHDDAGERPVGVSVAPLLADGGKLDCVIVTLTDLREVRTMEREMRRSEQLAALGELAAGVAHEIRNPLASISGAAQVLRGEAGQDGEDAELMDLIVSESDRLNRIIDGVLDYTRDHSNSRNLHDLAATAREVVRMVRHDKGLTLGKTLIVEFPEDQDFRAEVEEGGMKQVFYNLVRNAMEAMTVGGILRITGERSGNGAIHVVFRDSGQGIPPHELDHIFKPFHTSKPEGTGMGLSIASRIVEGNGGTIRARSTPGMGTAVTIELPVPPQGGSSPASSWPKKERESDASTGAGARS